MPDPDALALNEHPHDVEAIRIAGPAVPVDPHGCRANQLTLFGPVHRLDRIPELASPTRLHLDERDRTLALDHEVDVAMPASKSPLYDAPPLPLEPPFRDLLTQLAEFLFGR